MLTSPIGKITAIAALSVVASFMSASAATLQGFMFEFAQYTPYDPSSGAADWAIYGGFNNYPNNVGSVTSLTYKSGGPQSIGAVSGSGSGAGFNLAGPSGKIKLNYTDGAGSFPGSLSGNLEASDADPVFAQGDVANVTFNHTLLDGVETIYIVLFSEVAKVDLSASLMSGLNLVGSYSLTNTFLPTTNNGSFYTGLLAIDVSGAQAGDVLSFTTTANYTGITPDENNFKYTGVGVSAVSVFATVPEPSVLTLVCGAGALAILRRRRR